MFHRLKLLAAGVLTALGITASAQVQDIQFFTIGTGGAVYTYYPVGGMIAHAISKPPGSRVCNDGGSCGVENLVAMAVSSKGSIDNLAAIISGERDSGLAQSDVAYWTYTGTGVMEGKPPADNLRTIAALFEEHVHLVTLADSDIETLDDIKGKRVSLDRVGSATHADGLLILDAAGLNVDDVYIENLDGKDGLAALRNGGIDALFVIAGYPTAGLTSLVSDTKIKLVPITGETANNLIRKHGFFTKSDIPDGVYRGVGAVSTISVMAQWFTSAEYDEELIYKITKALWNQNSRRLFDVGHSKGRSITIDTALHGVGVPLHPGAERYYKEVGVIN